MLGGGGGGGGNVTLHGICICFPRKSFIIGVSYAPMGHLRRWRDSVVIVIS